MLCNKADGSKYIIDTRIRQHVAQVESNPSRPGVEVAKRECVLDGLTLSYIHLHEMMGIRTRTRTAATRLNTKQIIEQRDHKTIVQNGTVRGDFARKGRQSIIVFRTQYVNARMSFKRLIRFGYECPLPRFEAKARWPPCGGEIGNFF